MPVRVRQFDDIERVFAGGEAHVFGGDRLAPAFVETLRTQRRAFKAGPSPKTFHGRVPKMHSRLMSIQRVMPSTTATSSASIVPSRFW